VAKLGPRHLLREITFGEPYSFRRAHGLLSDEISDSLLRGINLKIARNLLPLIYRLKRKRFSRTKLVEIWLSVAQGVGQGVPRIGRMVKAMACHDIPLFRPYNFRVVLNLLDFDQVRTRLINDKLPLALVVSRYLD